MRVTCPHCGTIYRLTETVAARLPATLACVRCNESWLAQADPLQPTPAPWAAPPNPAPNPAPAQPAFTSPAPSAPAAPRSDPPLPAVETAPIATTEPPLPPPFITPVAPMIMPTASDGPSATTPMLERFSEQPIKFDQAALLRPDPPSTGRIAWLVSLLMVATILLLAVVLRTEISATWPPSVRAYQALGLVPAPITSPIVKKAAPTASDQTVAPPVAPGAPAAAAPAAAAPAAAAPGSKASLQPASHAP